MLSKITPYIIHVKTSQVMPELFGQNSVYGGLQVYGNVNRTMQEEVFHLKFSFFNQYFNSALACTTASIFFYL